MQKTEKQPNMTIAD